MQSIPPHPAIGHVYVDELEALVIAQHISFLTSSATVDCLEKIRHSISAFRANLHRQSSSTGISASSTGDHVPRYEPAPTQDFLRDQKDINDRQSGCLCEHRVGELSEQLSEIQSEVRRSAQHTQELKRTVTQLKSGMQDVLAALDRMVLVTSREDTNIHKNHQASSELEAFPLESTVVDDGVVVPCPMTPIPIPELTPSRPPSRGTIWITPGSPVGSAPPSCFSGDQRSRSRSISTPRADIRPCGPPSPTIIHPDLLTRDRTMERLPSSPTKGISCGRSSFSPPGSGSMMPSTSPHQLGNDPPISFPVNPAQIPGMPQSPALPSPDQGSGSLADAHPYSTNESMGPAAVKIHYSSPGPHTPGLLLDQLSEPKTDSSHLHQPVVPPAASDSSFVGAQPLPQPTPLDVDRSAQPWSDEPLPASKCTCKKSNKKGKRTKKTKSSKCSHCIMKAQKMTATVPLVEGGKVSGISDTMTPRTPLPEPAAPDTPQLAVRASPSSSPLVKCERVGSPNHSQEQVNPALATPSAGSVSFLVTTFPSLLHSACGSPSSFAFDLNASGISSSRPLTATALHSFLSLQSDELPFERGDEIALLENPSTPVGWLFGENSSRRRGIFPSRYVKLT